MKAGAMRKVIAVLIGGAALWAGCHAARLIAPPPSLRAASANSFGVDVEFDTPLDRASAEDPTRYSLWAAATPASPLTLVSATLIDTTFGRVVQILTSSGPLADTTDYVVTSHDVRDLGGRSTGDRSVTFRSGLSYRAPMKNWLDARCGSCHGPSQAAGSYRTDSYAALIGAGTDATPDLIAGDPNCLLIRKCRPGRSMWDAGHLSYLDFDMLLNWVASYGARF